MRSKSLPQELFIMEGGGKVVEFSEASVLSSVLLQTTTVEIIIIIVSIT